MKKVISTAIILWSSACYSSQNGNNSDYNCVLLPGASQPTLVCASSSQVSLFQLVVIARTLSNNTDKFDVGSDSQNFQHNVINNQTSTRQKFSNSITKPANQGKRQAKR